MQIFLNLHIVKATKTRGDKQLYLITLFTKQTLSLNYLLLTLNVTVQLLKGLGYVKWSQNYLKYENNGSRL